MGRVAGKVALVTGAARGQGRSHAVRLAEEGADIIALDLCAPVPGVAYPGATPQDLAETVEQVAKHGRRVVSFQVDTRDRAALTAAIDAGVAELGRLDIAVVNAGICIPAPWDEVTDENWLTTVDINLTGSWYTARAAAVHLVAAGGGSLILISSVGGLKGLPFLVPYVASKHGITGLARALAHELAQHSIRVNSVHPTGVETVMSGPELAEAVGHGLATNPRPGAMFTNSLPVEMTQPEDVSNAVLFLASDESRHVTALAMTVDAGNSQY
jgi:SDR family mycofactocin-dependent oxidoreductase